MHRQHRTTVRIVGALAALTLMAACGGRDDDTSSPTTTAAAAVTTTAATGATTTNGGASASSSPGSTAAATTAAGPTTYTDPGISDTEIVIGGSYPFSGSVSAFGSQGKGVEAFFEYMNETQGGIKFGDGKTRKVKFVTYDDGYEPQRAVENAKRLVEQDKVFALFNIFGSPTSAAVAPYANEAGVPMPYVSSSSDQWGDGERWPLATPFSIVGSTEGAVYASWLLGEKPTAKVAILYQNDDFGKGTEAAFKRSVDGTGVTVVAEESYQTTDPTVDSQITNLAASGADTFLMVATPKYAAQALTKIHELGWDPLRIAQTSGTNKATVLEPVGLDVAKGLVSLSWYKDVTDPQWADDPAVVEFKTNAAKYGADANDPFAGTGWLAGQMGQKLFESMTVPTRQGLVDAMLNMDNDGVGLMLPGIRLHTQPPNDRFPMEAAYTMTFDGQNWVLADKPSDAEGKTVPTRS